MSLSPRRPMPFTIDISNNFNTAPLGLAKSPLGTLGHHFLNDAQELQHHAHRPLELRPSICNQGVKGSKHRKPQVLKHLPAEGGVWPVSEVSHVAVGEGVQVVRDREFDTTQHPK